MLGVEGYSKKTNCFVFLESRALEDAFLLFAKRTSKMSGEEDSQQPDKIKKSIDAAQPLR
ncbi:hypothetical protein HYT01_03705 [Candidatus Giovannonibacteria bacterium]|nr:hypothetical protein [Candidatus Giovannonibacteria bacterium]